MNRKRRRIKYIVRRAVLSLILIAVSGTIYGVIRSRDIASIPSPSSVVYSPDPEERVMPPAPLPLWEVDDLVPAEFRELVTEAAHEFALPPRLLAAQVNVENAEWDPYAIGAAGEIGLLQILPETQQEVVDLGLVEMCDLTDPRCNLRTGAAYLSLQVARYNGDWASALRYYNGGPDWPEKPVTQEYADRVLSLMYSYSFR